MIQAEIELPVGSIEVRFILEKTEENAGIGRLFLNDVQIGEGWIPPETLVYVV